MQPNYFALQLLLKESKFVQPFFFSPSKLERSQNFWGKNSVILNFEYVVNEAYTSLNL
jgi:hypothetical protein